VTNETPRSLCYVYASANLLFGFGLYIYPVEHGEKGSKLYGHGRLLGAVIDTTTNYSLYSSNGLP